MTRPAYDSDLDQRDLFCARCGYNLRGLPTPRCPECGIIYDAVDFEAGRLRENVPSLMDSVDLWRPLDVLLRALATLLSATLRPGRAATAVDLRGPWRVTVVLWLAALAWVYVLVGVLMGVAVALHAGVSPGGALRAGMTLWAPRLIGAGFVAALAWSPLLTVALQATTARATHRAAARLLALATPALTLAACAPFCVGAVACPELLLGSPLRVMFPLLTVPWTAGVVRALTRRRTRDSHLRRRTAVWLLVGFVAVSVLSYVLSRLPDVVIPSSLEPPIDFFLR